MPAQKADAPFYEKLALVLLGLIALGYLVVLAKDILDPLIFGFLFAILLYPIALFFEKKLRLPRGISASLAILLLVAVVWIVLYVVGSQISGLASDWPQLKTQISQSVDDLSQWVQHVFHIDTSKQISYVHSTTQKLMETGGEVAGQTVGVVSGLVLFYVFIIVFTLLILLYRNILIRFIEWVFSAEYTAIVHDIVQNIQSILRQYILGLLLEMLVVACIACTCFLVIGIKYAVLLGIIVALFNLIPYVGIFTALVLSALITFATGNVNQVFWVVVCVIGIHLTDSNFLMPTIVGSKVKLNALISFLGIVLGEMIWGLSGMFLSIPIMAILKIVFDRVESLKPWGYLMGSGSTAPQQKSTVKKMKPAKVDKA